MSEHLRQEQDEINAADKQHSQDRFMKLSKSFADLYCEVTTLKCTIQELTQRCFALEEKERSRCMTKYNERDEHERDVG